jgi:hypothetical protein
MLLGTTTNAPASFIYQVNTVYHTWLNWEGGGGAGEFVLNYGYWTNGVDAAQHKNAAKKSTQR